MQHSMQIAGADVLVSYDYKIVCKGRKATWTDPEEPMEFELEVTGLTLDMGGGEEAPLVLPEWLKSQLTEQLSGSNAVYNKIVEEEDERAQQGDA